MRDNTKLKQELQQQIVALVLTLIYCDRVIAMIGIDDDRSVGSNAYLNMYWNIYIPAYNIN